MSEHKIKFVKLNGLWFVVHKVIRDSKGRVVSYVPYSNLSISREKLKVSLDHAINLNEQNINSMSSETFRRWGVLKYIIERDIKSLEEKIEKEKSGLSPLSSLKKLYDRIIKRK